jgi:hypothetical protein
VKTRKHFSGLAVFFLLCVLATQMAFATNRFCDGFEASRCGGIVLDLQNVFPRAGSKVSTSHPANEEFPPTQIFVKLPPEFWNDKTRLLLDGEDITPSPFLVENGFLTSFVATVDEGVHQVEVQAGAEKAGWSFTAGYPPSYVGITPRHGAKVPAGDVALKVSFDDAPVYGNVSSGIDTSSLAVYLDNVNVTKQGVVSDGEFSLSQRLSNGDHTLRVSIADQLGYATEAKSTFSVGSVPEFINCTSGDHEFETLNEITCDVRDLSDSIDAKSARAVLRRQGANVISGRLSYIAATDRTGRIQFIPSKNLTTGIYNFSVSIKNQLGTEGSCIATFVVGKKPESQVSIIYPANNAVISEARVNVRASASSNKSFVSELKLNGQIAEFKRVGNDEYYEKELSLQAGANEIRAVAVFQNGQSRTDVIQAIYDAPPEITITEPSDWQIFGPQTVTSAGNAANLTGNVERPIEITGFTSTPVSPVHVAIRAQAISCPTLADEKCTQG